MADEADQASERELHGQAEALARHQQSTAAHERPFEIQGKRVCVDCFEPINKKRLKANPNAVRCTEDQELHERRTRALG